MRNLSLILKIALTAGLLGYLSFKIDLRVIASEIRQSDIRTLAAGTLVLGLQPVIGAMRWHVILFSLRDRLPFKSLFHWTYISVFFGQVLPATVGADALRVWLAHRSGCPAKVAFNSVALDRVAMLLVLVLMLLASTPSLQRVLNSPELLALALVMGGGAVLALALLMTSDRLPGALHQWRIVRAIGYLAKDTRRLFLDPKYCAAAIALSLVSYLSIMLSVYLFSISIGAHPDFSLLMTLLPPVFVASTLPISVGGWGTREIAMITLLSFAGISADQAVLISVWLGVASILISLPGAFFYLGDRALKSLEISDRVAAG